MAKKKISFHKDALEAVKDEGGIPENVVALARKAGIEDASETMVFARELEHVKSRVYEIKHPEFKGAQLVPTSTEAGPYKQTVVYRVWDKVGVAKLMTNYSTDLPMVASFAKEKVVKFWDMGIGYGWSFRDIEMANANGVPLSEMDAKMARLAHDQALDLAISEGVPEVNTFGLLNHPNATTVSLSYASWATATGAQVLSALNAFVNTMEDGTNAIFRPNMLVMSPIAYRLIAQKFVDTTNAQRTVLEIFRAQNPDITVDSWNRCKGAAANPSYSRIVAYRKDPTVMEFEVGQYFTQRAPIDEGLRTWVPCVSRYAGLQVHIPAMLYYADLADTN